jgi:hypothetical protein
MLKMALEGVECDEILKQKRMAEILNSFLSWLYFWKELELFI